MKKTISIILLLIFVLSVTTFSADYYIDWFEFDDNYEIYYSDSEVIIFEKPKKDYYIMSDRNGRILTQQKYALIIPLVENSLYEGIYHEDNEKAIVKRHILNKNGVIIKNTNFEEIDEYSLYSFGKETSPDKFKPLFEGEKPADDVYVFGKYAMCSIGRSGEYALADNDGNLLSDYIYEVCCVADLSMPDSIIMSNESEMIIANCISGEKKTILREYGEDYKYEIEEGYIPLKVIGNDMCIAAKDEKYAFFNRQNKIIDDCLRINYENNFFRVDNSDGDFYYNIEGEKLFKCDAGLNYYGGAYDIIIQDKESLKAGKMIFTDTNPTVEIDGEYLYTDTLPRIRNNITLVPIRAISEKLGFEVAFSEGDILITKDDKEIKFKLGSKTAVINGEEKELASAPEIINDRTLVPIRAVAEAFGLEIEWDEDLRTVELMHNQSEV